MTPPPEQAADTTDVAEEAVLTSDGRVAGRRGRETRATLLASTSTLLGQTSYRDLKVVDIARDAGTSPATFYQYFGDVEEAILALASDVVDKADVLLQALESGDWTKRHRRASALALADIFLEFWDQHEPIMRVVNLAIVEGEPRYRAVRNELLGPVTVRLGELIAEHRSSRGPDTSPSADAAVAVSTIVHIAEHHPRLRVWGVPVEDLRQSLSRQIAAAFA